MYSVEQLGSIERAISTVSSAVRDDDRRLAAREFIDVMANIVQGDAEHEAMLAMLCSEPEFFSADECRAIASQIEVSMGSGTSPRTSPRRV